VARDGIEGKVATFLSRPMTIDDVRPPKAARTAPGTNPLKQRDETLAVLESWHGLTFRPSKRSRLLPLITVGLLLVACAWGASLAWV